MSNIQDPIDILIDQIEENDNIDTCAKCLCATANLLKTACNHTICLECIETSINENDYNNCLVCKAILPKNLHKMFKDYLDNPLNKLSYYHNMVLGDTLWYYEGNGHNWLYSKEHCIEIEEAYAIYDDDESDNVTPPDSLEIQINIGGKIDIYVINFSILKQYSKNSPTKKRNISCFKLNTINDLKKNKIVGVAGQLL